MRFTAVARVVALSTILAGATSCSTILAVGEQHKLMDASAVIGGTINTADHKPAGPLIVGLVTRSADGYVLVDHFVAEKPGSWVLPVAAGSYWVAAFEDANSDGRYEDEPAFRPDETARITLAPGQRLDSVNISIPKAGRFRRNDFSLADLKARGTDEQKYRSLFSLSVAGEVASLDDARFRQDVATAGMWKPYDFLLHSDPGIYFLEPYDPKRIPVLFVHGIGGTPINFRELIASLDRKRFQPWVAYYPGGGDLDQIGRWMTQLFVRLRTEYHFDKAAVVAHSMGGLVTRAFLLDDFEASGTKVVRTYVTISSPLGGMASAGAGVEQSPVVLRSWYGLAPGSKFLDGLFWSDYPKNTVRRRLPQHMAYHMMFGYHGSSGDGVVAISSELRAEAQDEARSLRGFDATHTGILEMPAVAKHLNEILADLR